MQIGYENFGDVRSKKLDFVDKTLFIKEVFDNARVGVSVITRPRRFGKTFNLSMLHHFLAVEAYQMKTAGMFDDLKIASVDDGAYMQHQGKYPVIFISFKEIRGDNYAEAYDKMNGLFSKLFREHSYLKQSSKLMDEEKEFLQRILVKQAKQSELEEALSFLTELLFKHHGVKPWLLIDEYDTPIQSGYLGGYYQEIVELMRGIFGVALKTNPYLNRAVITGVLRIAKESLFSGLNNIKVYSLLHPIYSKHFGFTEEEVSELLAQARLADKEAEVRTWYNGYVFGNTTVYNPWSIVNYLSDQVFKLYWVNTSDNQLIKEQLIHSSDEFKEQFNWLLQDQPVEKSVNEEMVYGDLKNNSNAVWSLLLMSGYVKAIATTIEMGEIICTCAIPNLEVKILYRHIIKEWLAAVVGMDKILYEDAKKEFSLSSRTGFGADGNRDIQKLDFEQVRGAFEKNAFVEAVLVHIEEKTKLGEEMIRKLN